MVRYENECCDCASDSYPCIGSACGLTHVPHYYCDECEDEVQLYEWGNQELCLDCIEKKLIKIN